LIHLVLQEILVEHGKAAVAMGDVGGHVGMPMAQPFRMPPGIALFDVNDGGIEQGLDVS
jgi:hypothetical protein